MKTASPYILLFAALLIGTTSSPDAAEGGIELRDGTVQNTEAMYSFAIPPTWELDPESDMRDVTVANADSNSSCSFLLKTNAHDVATEFKGLKLAVPFIGGKWSLIESGWSKLGGRKAGRMLSTRTYPEREPLREWNYVSVYKGQAYLIQCSVPELELKQITPDVERILNSFAWEKKKKN